MSDVEGMSDPKARVFVVEDEALIAMELSDRLEGMGYTVCGTAARGEDALREIPEAAPDIVLMDVQLAGEATGIDTARALRELVDTPVVFVTAFSDDDIVGRAMEAMPFGYIVKPFDERELNSTIQAALVHHRLERQLRSALSALDQRTRELAENERFMREVLDALGSHLAVLDEHGRIVTTNAAWREFGQENGAGGSMVGTSYLGVCEAATGECVVDARAVARGIREVLSGERVRFVHEYQCPTPDGRRWFLCRVAPLELGGAARQVVVSHDDVTIVRRALERVAAGERAFASLADLAPVGIFRTDAEGRATDLSRRWSEITGLTEDEGQGEGWIRALHPEDRAAVRQAWQAAFTRGEPFVGEYRFVRANGDVTWVLGQAAPIPDGEGGVAGYIGTITDVTHRKRIELALHELTTGLSGLYGQRYFEAAARRLADALGADVACVWRSTPVEEQDGGGVAMILDGRVRKETPESLGGLCAELLDGASGRILPRGAREAHPHAGFFAETGIEAYATEPLTDASGRVLGQVSVMSRKPFQDPATVDTILKLFATGMSAEMGRDRYRREYEDLFEFSPDALALSDQEGRIVLVNRQMETLFGWSREELVGQPIEVLVPQELRGRHAGLRDLFVEEGRARRMADDQLELVALRKDGDVFPVEIHLAPVRTDAGLMIAAAIRDVTERKALQEQLSHALKMEALGKLTGGMAHDFNNYLGIILGNLELLRESGDWDESTRELIDGAIGGAEKGAELTRSLLAFSRRQPLNTRLTAVNDRLEDMARLLARTLGSMVEVATDFDPELWTIRVDGAQLDSCIVNLANNARDAMPDGGRVTIRTRNVSSLDTPAHGLAQGLPLGDAVLIEVADTGSGIPEESLARVTEPFFTTKGPGHGTGLGLSMVYGFVSQSGGHVEIDSTVGEGTTVRLYFPRPSELEEAEVASGHGSEQDEEPR